MNIEKLIRKNIKRLKPYSSARDLYESGILMDANENAYEPVFTSKEDLNRYPDPRQLEIRKALSEYTGVPSENLFTGVGSDEIIDLLIRIFCEPGIDSALIIEPTYGMYKVACDINNVETIYSYLNNEFQIDFENVKQTIKKSTKLVFLCSPNNPTGNLLNKEDIKQLCRYFSGMVIVDEAYIEFAGNGTVINEIGNYENLIVLRTFSKAWGMAGVRFGYCAANKTVIDYLFKIKLPYNLSKLTGSAVINALKNAGEKDELIRIINKNKTDLIEKLKKIDSIEKVFHSDANFILFKIDNAGDVQKKLAERGVIIRDRSSSPGLDNCLRVSVGTPEENKKFIGELNYITTGVRADDKDETTASGFTETSNISADNRNTERAAEVFRKTNETNIRIVANLDGSGESDIDTGIGFFDHMLDQIARHGNIDLYVKVKGDLIVDEHHTVEDTGIALGEALLRALGDRKGIKRYGFFLPMDDSVAKCAIDLGGRSYLNFKCKFKREKVGEFPTELTEEFFRGLANGLKANIYLKASGKNEHHKIEAMFKAFAKSLNEASRIDERAGRRLPTTKGVI